ncbi:unnamed protein product, partial [Rotaria magnacalcarata]
MKHGKSVGNDNLQSLFSLDKFGDENYIVKFLRLIDYHYTCTRTHIDENINRMRLLTIPILKVELKELLKSIIHEKMTEEIFNKKAPLFYLLETHDIEESIRFLAEPSFINLNNYDDET